MHISPAVLALAFLIASFIYAAFIEKAVNSLLLAVWSIAILACLSGGGFLN